jgi:acetyl esterase/lipase
MSRIVAVGRVISRWAPAVVLVGLLVAPVTARAQSDVEVVSGERYATHRGVELLLDVYRPAGDGPFPAVIVIPGGKWVEIDRTKHADVPTYFATHGIVAFSVDYRSALEFPYPAAVRDVAAAVRWVRGHAADYDVDPARLGAVGVSSGGHLAALVATRGSGPHDEGSRVSVVASWSGMMDLRPLVAADDEEMRSAVRTFLGCSAAEPCDRPASAASPITHVDPTDPPMVLVNGSDEIVPVDQAESMSAALNDAGVESHVTIAQGGHGAGYGGGTKILDQVIPFIQAWLAGEDAPSASPQEGVAGEAGAAAAGCSRAGASAPPAPPPPPQFGDKRQQSSTGGDEEDSSFGVPAVAIAMIASVFVIVSSS